MSFGGKTGSGEVNWIERQRGESWALQELMEAVLTDKRLINEIIK